VTKEHRSVISNILGADALTGCDTVSSFSGIGKTAVLSKLKSFPDQLLFGNLTVSTKQVTDSCMQFVASLYNQKTVDTLSSMRAAMFTAKIAGKCHTPPKLKTLPPTTAAFHAHCLQAHYRMALWMSAGLPSPPDLDPLDYGWESLTHSSPYYFGAVSRSQRGLEHCKLPLQA